MRTGTTVYKYDQNGELVHTYTSFIKAYQGERVSPARLRGIIQARGQLNGCTFSYGKICTLAKKDETDKPKEEKYFNIESWRSICF